MKCCRLYSSKKPMTSKCGRNKKSGRRLDEIYLFYVTKNKNCDVSYACFLQWIKT